VSERLVKEVFHRASGSSPTFGDPKLESIRRLRLIARGAAVLPAIALVIMLLLAPEGSAIRAARGTTIVIISIVIGLSLALSWLLKNERVSVERRLDIGFGYQVILALLIATMRHLVPWVPDDGFRETSPVALLILVFAALIPMPPGRTLAVSLASAAMEPLGLLITLAHGNPNPSIPQWVAITAGPLGAALGATAISRVLHGLARSVTAARRMGSYRLVEKRGEGGMGEVWRAEHDLLARPAAIKLMRPGADHDADRLKRFEREARATAALRAPNTIALYDFGQSEDGTFYYAMELLDGVDLENLVRATGPLPPARAVFVLVQICESLEEAHRQGLVHRDIKPANILLCRYGLKHDFVKVLDFGLVRAMADGDTNARGATLTQANAILGTPAFIAPELAVSATSDARVDIYAFGCVAYWLLTGELVFEAESPMQMIVRHVHDEPDAPSTRSPAVPPELDAIVLDCLKKAPGERPASMAEVQARLAAIRLESPWTEPRAEAWWNENGSRIERMPLELSPTEAA
jgi:serine/threonine-protein kinase